MLLRLICKIGSGGTAPQKPAEYCCNGLTFIKASNLDDIINDQSEVKACKITKESAQYHRYKEYPPQTILFAKSGISCTKNRVYITKEKSFIVNHLCALVVISSKINPKWLMLFISHFNVTCLIKDNSYPSISLESIGNIEVPIISLKKQQEIISSIDRIKVAIKEKGHQLEAFDSLAKSRFNEMFGDSDLTPQLLRWQPIKEVAKVMTGTTPSTSDSENWDGHILWVTPAEMKEDSFYIFDTERKITEKGQQSKSLQLMPVDTVLLSTRAPIGKVGIVGKEMCCNQGFKNFAFNPLYVNPVFAYWLLKMNTVYLQSIGKGTTFKEISKSNIEKVRIPVPEINRQNEFANFVKQIDKSKFVGHSRYFL